MRLRTFAVSVFSLLSVLVGGTHAAESSEPAAFPWKGVIAAGDRPLTVLPPTAPDAHKPWPVVFYLENLSAPRIGTDSNDAIVADLRAAGHLVVIVDYQNDPRARVPFLNRDLAKLRDDFRAGALLKDLPVDPARVYIVPAGHRLKRDIVFYRDAGRTLALDLIYPSGQPAKKPGTVLEFSCDNKDRMGNTSLSICSDTLLDGLATEGFAVAMADHPVAPPYKGLDAMPESAWKIKAAVRTLRTEVSSLGLGDRIVPVGFSRGSGMALMLLTTEGLAEFEGHGENPGVSSAVQGAAVMSGRFTYLQLLPDDHMIPRYDKAWGTLEKNRDTWRAHGALDYLKAPTAPLFLTINCSEAPDALFQMTVLRKRLAELGNDEIFLMDRTPRGHKVALDPAILEALSRYVARQLSSD
jgi:acetyl esterase/lipase